MRALRTIPVLLDVCRDMEELCPDALLLNYVNPMAMICWAIAAASRSAPSGSATACSTPPASWRATSACPAEVDYLVAGINHMAFFLRFERDGEDLYPALRGGRRGAPPTPNRVRYELLRRFGYFVTESTRALRRVRRRGSSRAAAPDLIERFNIPLDEYPRRCEAQIAELGELRGAARGRRRRSRPSAATSTAPTSSTPARPASRAFNGNVPNRGGGC